MGAALTGILTDAIGAFNQLYPNITVQHQSYGNYDALLEQIRTEITAGNQPSLAYCYPDHVALYNKSGAVATLDDYIASETMGLTQEQANGFVRAYYEEGRAFGDGKMYTLPYSKSTEVLYYNKTFFDQHNIQVPKSYEDLEIVIQQIAAIDPTCIPLGYDSEANWFITMTEQLGTPYTSAKNGEKFLFDVESNRAFVERLREWFQYSLVTTEEIYGSYTSGLFTETDPEELKSYMCIGSSAGASYQIPAPTTNDNNETVYPFEVGVALPPQVNPDKPKVISQGPSLCMFKKKDKQEMAAAWLFMKFLTTNLGLQANFSSQSGYAPVIDKLDEKFPAYAEELALADGSAHLQMTCVKQCLAQENALFVSPAFIGSSGARDQVGILIQNCFVNAPAQGQSAMDFVKSEFKKSVDKLRYDYKA
jgi:multiple sugar transport system substrate-binding protein